MEKRRPRVVVTHWVHREVADYLAEFCDATLPTRDEGVWSRSTVAEQAADADGLIVCMADSIDESFLSHCQRLRVVSATLKGYDNFDTDACSRRGIWLTIVPDALIGPTAELTVGLMIGVIRRVVEGHDRVRAGGFSGWRPELYGSTLAGATVGLVGMGALGQAVARRLAGFDADLTYHDVRRLDSEAERHLGLSYQGLDDLAQTSDILVVVLSLTAQTRGLIGRSLLQRVRPGAFLVNTGRGSVVDEQSVAQALESGRLGGYAADVFAMEDWLLPDRPAGIPDRLLQHPRTLLTPHLGSAVDHVRREMSLAAAHQLRQALEGRRPEHAVNDPDLDPNS